MKHIKVREILSLIAAAIFALAMAACDPVKEAEDKLEEDSLNYFYFQLFLLNSSNTSSGPVDPQVRIYNFSGVTQTYSLHSGSLCSSTAAAVFPENPVAPTVTTSYVSVPDGSYSISYNPPATSNCSLSTRTFAIGLTYICTAGTTNVTCELDL